MKIIENALFYYLLHYRADIRYRNILLSIDI